MGKHIGTIRRSLFSMFMLFAFSGYAQGESASGNVRIAANQKTVTVAVVGNYPPYDFFKDGIASGIANDMMKEVFARLDMQVAIKELPFKRALEYVKSGYVDALAGLGKNPEREQYVLYPDIPLAKTNVSFFVRKGSGITYRGDLSEMARYTIGTVSGFMYTRKFQNLVDRGILHTDESATVESNIQKLLGNRYDVFVANSGVTWHVAKQLGVSSQIRELPPPVDTGYMYLGISKKSPLASSIDKINAALISIQEDGTEKKIYGRYAK